MTEAWSKPADYHPEPEVVGDHPQVFTRAIATPPGSPWEQLRAANLEARHGAPLPLSELMHRVKRLSRWSPGRPGRFAVFYVRTREFRGPFETGVEVDGQVVKVAFGVGGEQVQRAQRLGLLALLMAVGLMVLGGALTVAWNARMESSARLEAAEKLAAAKLASARRYRRQIDQGRELHAAIGHAQPVSAVINDLTWAATSKTADARIAAIHWEAGVLAVEVRGDKAPFTALDRRIERSAKPLRPGVWLWGVSPMPADGAGQPTVAGFGP